MNLDNVDLRAQPRAQWYAKHETVAVVIATCAGSVASREGANRYLPGDALITAANGDRWSVSRPRFDARYEPVAPLAHGADGAYRARPVPVLALQMPEDFTVRRSPAGDRLQGRAGDWLLQYAPGDWGIVEAVKFQRVYRRCDGGAAP